MKKIGKYIPRILLLDTAVFMAMAVTALFVIKAFHMTFREWVFFAAGAIILLGTIAGLAKSKIVPNIAIQRIFLLLFSHFKISWMTPAIVPSSIMAPAAKNTHSRNVI